MKSNAIASIGSISGALLLRLSLSVWVTSGNIVSEHSLQGEPLAAAVEDDNWKEAVGGSDTLANSPWLINNWEPSLTIQPHLSDLILPCHSSTSSECHVLLPQDHSAFWILVKLFPLWRNLCSFLGKLLAPFSCLRFLSMYFNRNDFPQ